LHKNNFHPRYKSNNWTVGIIRWLEETKIENFLPNFFCVFEIFFSSTFLVFFEKIDATGELILYNLPKNRFFCF